MSGRRLEASFVALVVGLALAAWSAVLLAEAGRLRLLPFLAASAVAATLVFAGLRRLGVRTDPAHPANGFPHDFPHSMPTVPAAGAVVVLCAVIFVPPYETFLWGSDSTVYLNLGAEIARNGGYALPDPLLAEMPAPARAELFSNPAGRDSGGTHVRLPGGLAIPDIEDPTVVAGFSPVFPALLAVVDDLLGARAMPWIAPISAILGMLALFLLGCRLGGMPAGLGATGLAAVSLPQMWFARFPMPEIVAELFVVTALLALAMAPPGGEGGERRLIGAMGCIAGLLLGVAALAKFELLPIVAVALTAFAGLGALWTGRWPRRAYFWMAGSFAVLLVHAALHYLLVPSHYTPFIRRELSSNYVVRAVLGFGLGRSALLLAGVCVVAIVTLSRHRDGLRSNLDRPRWWGGAMLLMVAAYFLRGDAAGGVSDPIAPPGLWSGLAQTFAWLSWYLPWPVWLTLAAATIAVAGWSWRPRETPSRPVHASSAAAETLLFAAVLVLVACLHLYRSPDTEEHIWTMRRFVPVVLPGVALLTATMITGALRRAGGRRGDVVAALVLVVLTGVVAIPGVPILGQPLWRGSLEATEDIAALLPQKAVALVSADLAGTHLATTLNYIGGKRAIVLRPPLPTPTLVGDLAAEWIDQGRPIFLISGEQGLSFYAPHLALEEVARRVLAIPILERTRDRPPRRIVGERAPLTISRLRPRSGAVTSIDVGNPSEDALFRLSGFHGPESDASRPDATFRWTTGSATILVPATGGVRLTLSGARPEGANAARISISVDGILVISNLKVSDEPMEVVVDLSLANEAALSSASPRLLMITSTTFHPARVGDSEDERPLGVRLYRVDLIEGA